MRHRFRIATLWLAAAFVLAGAVAGFAQGDDHGADVSAVAKPTATPPGTGHGKDVREAAKNKDEDESAEDRSERSGERKQNHGFFVSQAAHCENVDDPATTQSPDFTAPENCADDGNAHGKYVGSVARSSAGKPDKAGGPKPDEGSGS